ncbi:MAG TPA: FtsX-like permease family protein [Gemmatimonadales bacterium]|nr:FtsX-like permease family protein [Gemmatimonadales bacterium]
MTAPFRLAAASLRLERRLLLLLLAAVTLTAALVVPTELLPRLGLRLETIPSLAGAIALTDAAQGPTEAQHRTLADLLAMLRSLGWAALGVAGLTILSLYAVSSTRRSHELSIHRAVGASRRALLAMLLVEALAVAAAALLLGGLAGRVALATGLATWPGAADDVRPWPLAVGAVLVLLVVVGRLLPIHVARGRDVPERDEAAVSLWVPIVQFGASLALLVAGSALFMGSAARPVVPAAGGDGALVGIDASALDAPARSRLYATLLDALRDDGVPAPSLASAGQPLGLGTVDFLTTHCGMCFRGGIYLEYVQTEAVHHTVSPDSFAANNIPLLAGRAFTRGDTLGAARVAVINRQMALRHFQPGDPLGRRLFLSDGFPGTPYTVIGVVDDGVPEAFGAARQPRPRVYLSSLQQPPAHVDVLLRTSDPAHRSEAIAHVAELAAAAGAQAALPRAEASYRADATAPARWLGGWALFAGLVLVLVSTAGLASTVWRWVVSLQDELALRRALGARRAAVLWFVGWRAGLVALAGVGVALVVLGTVVHPVFTGTLRGIPLWQPRTLAVSGVALAIVSLASALVPARRLAHAAPARHRS